MRYVCREIPGCDQLLRLLVLSLNELFLRSCNRRDPDFGGAGGDEDTGTLACGSATGQDVVDEQDFAAADVSRDFEGSTQVAATAFGGKHVLAFGSLDAAQHAMGSGQLPGRPLPGEQAQGLVGQQHGLVVATFALACAEEWHGDDQELV